MRKERLFGIFSRIPTLETDRIILRGMKVSDTDDMFDYAHRADVTRFLTWRPHRDRSYTKQYLEYLGTRYAAGDFYDWAVVLRSENRMIGTCGFTRIDLSNNSGEIGYVINPDYSGMGIATEAAARVLDFGFRELSLHRIEARHMAGNGASHRVMEKLGMTEEGTFRESYLVNGKYRTVTICSILDTEYRELCDKNIQFCEKKA